VSAVTPRKILIDTDPGIDDAMAIFYALESPELDVIGLTSIFGNAETEVTTVNALKLLEIAGRSDIPVARGVDNPLAMPYRGAVAFVHGTDGQGDVFLPPPKASVHELDAANFIVRSVLDAPGEITLVALGPLTNVALAMQLEPTLGAKLAGIVLMGGNAFVGGNASPAAEANIINDPEAADIVFGAECGVVMAGLDVTESTIMTTSDLARMATFDNARARHLAAIIPFYEKFYLQRLGIEGICVHDSSTISYLLKPELYTWVEYPVRVDVGDSVCRGKTQPAVHVSDVETAWTGRRPTRILTAADTRAVIELELERLAR
jgi:inosine-uridine nucleoside N-ribohydrolase